MAYGYVATRLRFTHGGATVEPDLFKQALTVTAERRLGDRWTLQLGLGATTWGELRLGNAAYAIDPGLLALVATSFRAVDESRRSPFVLFTGSLSASSSPTQLRGTPADAQGDSIVATDGRVGVAIGKTIADAVSVYAAARAFGLPVFWSYGGASVTGTDVHHYQVGAGFVLRLGRFDASLEMMPLGERAITAGAGVSFDRL